MSTNTTEPIAKRKKRTILEQIAARLDAIDQRIASHRQSIKDLEEERAKIRAATGEESF